MRAECSTSSRDRFDDGSITHKTLCRLLCARILLVGEFKGFNGVSQNMRGRVRFGGWLFAPSRFGVGLFAPSGDCFSRRQIGDAPRTLQFGPHQWHRIQVESPLLAPIDRHTIVNITRFETVCKTSMHPSMYTEYLGRRCPRF